MKSKFYGHAEENGPRLLDAARTANTLRLCYGAELPVGTLCDAQGRPDPTGEKVTFAVFKRLVKRLREDTSNTN